MTSLKNQWAQALLEWQPIETAPKDYTYVLLWDGSWHWIGIWDEDFGKWEVDGERHEDLIHTHWMPLPPPPKKGDE